MAHARRKVREAVGTILNTTPTNWNKAFEMRTAPIRDVLPCLLVYVESETSRLMVIHPANILEREMSLVTKGLIRLSNQESIEDVMDAVAAEIETKLSFSTLNTALSGKLKGIELTGTETELVSDDLERNFAEVSLIWRVQVMTAAGTPETLI